MSGSPVQRRLLVVEDDPFTGALLSGVLQSHGFVVRVEQSAISAKVAMKEFDADGALLDIQLGDGPSGIELAQIFYEVYPHCALALLTRFPDPATAGISVKKLPPNCGFLRKDLISDSNYLLKALEDILTDHGSEYRADKDGLNPFGKLTFTQLEILKLVAEGLTNSAIATKRSTSESAVEQTLSAIMRGLDIKSDSRVNPRTEMARRYIQIAGVPERENEN